MEVSVIERINATLRHFGKTPNGLANMLGMTPSTVNRQLKGDQSLSSKVIEGVLTVFPDVSAEWLMRGVGTMYIREDIGYSSSMVAEAPCHDEPKVVEAHQDDSIWKAKYEAIKDCYDMLVSNLGGVIGKRSVG